MNADLLNLRAALSTVQQRNNPWHIYDSCSGISLFASNMYVHALVNSGALRKGGNLCARMRDVMYNCI